jgi:osmoprotectant transport system permease protein
MAGVRTASIEVVATSTLAAYVSYSDLGTYVITGLNTQNSVLATAGALLVGALAAAVAIALSVAGRYLTPLPLRHRPRVRTFTARPALS